MEKSFMYKFPGEVYANGPVKAPNLALAIKKVKRIWELERKNFEIWESDGVI
jgi:hypothetical protein